MNKLPSLFFAALLALVATSTRAAGETAAEQENAFLALVLSHADSQGGYTVVAPETRLSHMNGSDEEEIKQGKKYVSEQLAKNGDAVPALVDRLYERNRKSEHLSLKSSPKDGYIIDDGAYEKYFQEGGGGWEKWHREQPQAHGYTTVSLPVYDEKSGLLLIYIGTQYDWLAGAGFVVLFRYEKGALHPIDKVMMWVS